MVTPQRDEETNYKHQKRDSMAERMQGNVVFQWRHDGNLVLLQNMNTWDHREIKAASWDGDGNILRSVLEPGGGSWFGCSKQGRVASLVNGMPSNIPSLSEFFPEAFLKDHRLTPHEFAKKVAQDKVANNGLTSYHLIVADVKSKSMVCVSKKAAGRPEVQITVVDNGVHVLSSHGLDKEEVLKTNFTNKIAHPKYLDMELSQLQTLCEEFMTDICHKKNLTTSTSTESRYGTANSTALVMKPTGEAILYERYMENNSDRRRHHFIFQTE